jgi:hypothetical protein
LIKKIAASTDIIRAMQQNIRKEIIFFREKLNDLKSNVFSWAYTPVPDFKDKENYPIDFQIFMEEIGTLSASNDFNAGYMILLLDLEENIAGYKEGEKVLERNQISYFSKDIRMVARDVDEQYYGFITLKKPYEFFSTWEVDRIGDTTIGLSFWDWFKKHMFDSIEEPDRSLVFSWNQ